MDIVLLNDLSLRIINTSVKTVNCSLSNTADVVCEAGNNYPSGTRKFSGL